MRFGLTRFSLFLIYSFSYLVGLFIIEFGNEWGVWFVHWLSHIVPFSMSSRGKVVRPELTLLVVR